MNLLNIFSLIYLLMNGSIVVFGQQKLGAYKVLKDSITVSGISSGAAMAVQLHTAFSKTFSAVGVVTGPPYYCPQSSGTNAALTTCMSSNGAAINVDQLATALNGYVSRGLADDPINMKNDKVYIYHGTSDTTVTEGVVKKNEDFYKKFISVSQFKTLYTINSAHGFITNNFGGSCSMTSSTNYINNCNYNQAYDILKHFYNLQTPEPEKNLAYKELLIEFDQTEFFPTGTSGTITMDTTGYAYVPKACKDGKACRVHVALHGCLQGKYKIGNVFADKTGYNQVADANDIIIIYPQAKSSALSNPNGCWDWWGYINQNYANKSGPQMAAIKNMVDRLSSGGIIDEIDNGGSESGTGNGGNGGGGETSTGGNGGGEIVTCFGIVE